MPPSGLGSSQQIIPGSGRITHSFSSTNELESSFDRAVPLFPSPGQLPCIPGSPDSSYLTEETTEREHSQGPRGCHLARSLTVQHQPRAGSRGFQLSAPRQRDRAASVSGKADGLRELRMHLGFTHRSAVSCSFSDSTPH